MSDRKWYEASKKPGLSKDLLEDFKDDVDWGSLSRYQTLSENFILKFKDRIDWSYTFQHIKNYQKNL